MATFPNARSSRRASWLLLPAAAFLLVACLPAPPSIRPSAINTGTAEQVPALVPVPSSTASSTPAAIAIAQEAATAIPPKVGELLATSTWIPSSLATGTRPALLQASSVTPSAPPPPVAAMPTLAPHQPVLTTLTSAPLANPDVPALPPNATLTPAPTRTPGPTPSVDLIVDDADPGTTYSGAWFGGDGGASYQGGCHWAPPGPNFAAFRPDLPVAGSYEIYAWGCGDLNHDQVYRTDVSIYPFRSGVYAPPRAGVDLKDDPGRWVSIGIYYLEPGGWVGVGPWDARDWDAGNQAVDAFRFVFRSPAHVDVTPTPAPTRVTWTTHPPSPEAQLTSGDLDARLGLVQWLYDYTPAGAFESTTFDDCTVFPRAGCAGTRSGWRMTVRYLGREPFAVTYRVSDDLRYVSLDAPDALRGRQLRYLSGQNGLRTLNVYRYPDGTWYVNVADRVTGGGGGRPLSPDKAAILEALAGTYASIGTGRDRVVTPDGWQLRLYGLGTRVALDEDDRSRLQALVGELAGTLLP